MVRSRLSAAVEKPNLDVIVDLGHPLLNSSVDGFLKVGGVGVAHAAVQDTFRILRSDQVTKNDLEKLVRRAGFEGLQWGAVAGVYAGVEYSLKKACAKKQDWKRCHWRGSDGSPPICWRRQLLQGQDASARPHRCRHCYSIRDHPQPGLSSPFSANR
ncbi:outer envelope pore protein 16, chloroplastic isoform X1 [Physcomitrium patens]|uniref:Uncharacterized protein n=1 Tax=Physcomitrium patens TaxID=3218 RepID=A0A7I4FLA5_PHYPA